MDDKENNPSRVFVHFCDADALIGFLTNLLKTAKSRLNEWGAIKIILQDTKDLPLSKSHGIRLRSLKGFVQLLK